MSVCVRERERKRVSVYGVYSGRVTHFARWVLSRRAVSEHWKSSF